MDDFVTAEERQARTSSEVALLAERKALEHHTALVPCPFCGGEGSMTTGRSAAADARLFFNPSCETCDYVFEVGFFHVEDAVAAWNTRTPAPQPTPDAEGDGPRRYLRSEIQHLLETQTKLVEALRRRVSPTKCYCNVMLGAKCGECADRELLHSLSASTQEK